MPRNLSDSAAKRFPLLVDSYASTETRVQPEQPDGYYSRPWLDVDYIITDDLRRREPSVTQFGSSAENIGAGGSSFNSSLARVL